MGTNVKVGIIVGLVFIVAGVAYIVSRDKSEVPLGGANSNQAPTRNANAPLDNRNARPAAANTNQPVKPPAAPPSALNANQPVKPPVTTPPTMPPAATQPTRIDPPRPIDPTIGGGTTRPATPALPGDAATSGSRSPTQPVMPPLTPATGPTMPPIATPPSTRPAAPPITTPPTAPPTAPRPGSERPPATQPTMPPLTPPKAGESGKPTKPIVGGAKYKIQSGDTFYKIAEEVYGDGKYWTAIRDANPDVDPNRMAVGEEIVLPPKEAVTAGAPAKVKPPAATTSPAKPKPAAATTQPVKPKNGAAAPKAGSKTHTVAKGETLALIARTVLGDEYRWREIYELNRDKLDSPDQLKEGTVLRLPDEGGAKPTTRGAGR